MLLQGTRTQTAEVWYQLLLHCAGQAECQAALQQQVPDILQQLQHSGHTPTAFLLALRAGQASLKAEQAEAALAEARRELRQARAVARQQLIDDGILPDAVDSAEALDS